MAAFLQFRNLLMQLPAANARTLDYVDHLEVHPPRVTFVLTSSLPSSEWTPELQDQLVTVLVCRLGLCLSGKLTVHADSPTAVSGRLLYHKLDIARRDGLAFLRDFCGDHILTFDVHVAAAVRCQMRGVNFAVYMIAAEVQTLQTKGCEQSPPSPVSDEWCNFTGLTSGKADLILLILLPLRCGSDVRMQQVYLPLSPTCDLSMKFSDEIC